jgi:uncharacterized damage-inducible protein DinB
MKNALLTLLNYELWANQTVINRLQQADSPPERAVQLMGHILSAQEVWFGRLHGNIGSVASWQDIPLDKMAERAEQQYLLMKVYLTNLTDEQLAEAIAYQNSTGKSFQNTVQDILVHLSHHAAYHRGQVVQLIRPLLTEMPMTDFIAWVRDKQ